MSSVHIAPKYTILRDAVNAVDISNPTSLTAGLNFAGYDKALFQVIPSGGANPSIEVLSWSEDAGVFISENPLFTASGLGVNIPYGFTMSAYGRVLWVKITTLAAGLVNVLAAGRRLGDIS